MEIIQLPKLSFTEHETTGFHANNVSLHSFDTHKEFILEETTGNCPICYDTYPVSKLVKSLKCDHVFCVNCLTEYLKARINSMKVVNIPCPFSGCEQIFQEKLIEKFVDKPTFKLYEDLLLKKTINRNLDVKFCPKPGCSKPFTPSLKQPYTICKCKTKICNTCCKPWHEGKTCLQAIDPDFELYAKQEDIKFCVMCKTHVQKVEGCKHITCPICDYEWCWDCGKEYKKDHQAKCTQEWSPAPPNFSITYILKERWTLGSKKRKFFMIVCAILLSPLILCGVVLFWPLWKFFDPYTHLSKKRPFKSLCIVIVSMLLGIVLTPLVILKVIIYLFFCPLYWYWSAEIEAANENTVHSPRDAQQPKQKRWKNLDPMSFSYTTNSRPEIPKKTTEHVEIEIRTHRDYRIHTHDLSGSREILHFDYSHHEEKQNFHRVDPARMYQSQFRVI